MQTLSLKKIHTNAYAYYFQSVQIQIEASIYVAVLSFPSRK